jgi:fucose 4-O-acetylase-like acetyltransferase
MSTVSDKIQHLFSKAFNTSVLLKTRLQWVDYLKGIAIILVVYRHVLIGIERSGISIPGPLVTANMIFFSFRMPLFFILSGIFINSSIAKRTLKQLVSIKFENLLYPYLVWAFLQVTIQIVLSGSTNSNRGLMDYTYIFYQPRNLDQFWYLPALFNTTVIYLLIKTRLKPQIWMQLLLGLVLYFLSPYFERVSMMSDWMEFYLFFALGDAISPLFFRDSSQQLLKKPVTLLALVPVFILTQYYYLNYPTGQLEFLLVALTGCLCMFVLSFRLQCWNVLRFLRVIGYHSLYIYVMHVMASAFVRLVLMKFAHIHQPVILLFTCCFFGVIVPVIFYNLVIKDNIGWFLFSFRKTSARSATAKEPAPGVLSA